MTGDFQIVFWVMFPFAVYGIVAGLSDFLIFYRAWVRDEERRPGPVGDDTEWLSVEDRRRHLRRVK